MIKCKNLSYQPIFKKINFIVQRGKTAVVLGLKGSGKTTLLDCLSGNCNETKGEFYINNCRYLKELPSFCENLTGNEYVDILMTLSSERNKKEIFELIEKLCLGKELNKRISEACPYTRKVLTSISSFCLDSDTILIDEPFKDFDYKTQRIVIEIIKQLKQTGKTILIATNDIDLSYEFADDIILLHNGGVKKFANDFESIKQYENQVLSLLMS